MCIRDSSNVVADAGPASGKAEKNKMQKGAECQISDTCPSSTYRISPGNYAKIEWKAGGKVRGCRDEETDIRGKRGRQAGDLRRFEIVDGAKASEQNHRRRDHAVLRHGPAAFLLSL